MFHNSIRLARTNMPTTHSPMHLRPSPFKTILCSKTIAIMVPPHTIKVQRRIGPALPVGSNTLEEALGHFRRYTPQSLFPLGAQAELEVEKILSVYRNGVPGWLLKANILNRTGFGNVQRKIDDSRV